MTPHSLHTQLRNRSTFVPRSFRRGREGKGLEWKRSKNLGRSPHASSLCEGRSPSLPAFETSNE